MSETDAKEPGKPSDSQEQEDVVEATPSPQALDPHADRTKRLENWLKFAAVLIAALALVAPIASAVAAWSSLQTAGHSLEVAQGAADVAREVAEKSGSVLRLSNAVDLHGACGDPENPLVIIFSLENAGRIAGRMTSARLAYVNDLRGSGMEPESIDPRTYTPGLEDEMRFLEATTRIIASTDAEVQVAPNDSAKVELQIDCEMAAALGFGHTDTGIDIARSVYERRAWWIGIPRYAYNSVLGSGATIIQFANYYPERR